MSNYEIADLVKVAKRENNTKRPYLYVNPLQGKHIPVNPGHALSLFEQMAELIEKRYFGKKILVVGFAETATAVSLGIAKYAESVKYVMHTTREKYDGAEYLFFTESHSHATEQSLIINELQKLSDRFEVILFAEDEVTTGNTICKLIDCLNESGIGTGKKYGIISILNSMSDERLTELMQEGIFCDYIKRIPFEYSIDSIDKYNYEVKTEKCDAMAEASCREASFACNTRFVQNKEQYMRNSDALTDRLAEDIVLTEKDHKILVLGTEEFMFIPMLFAKRLEQKYPACDILFHATTRSPILASEDEGYPLNNRSKLASLYEESRVTYIYNLQKYDRVFLLTDAGENSDLAMNSIKTALGRAGNSSVQVIRIKYDE